MYDLSPLQKSTEMYKVGTEDVVRLEKLNFRFSPTDVLTKLVSGRGILVLHARFQQDITCSRLFLET